MEIILASQSPRRRELLERMGIKNFRIVTPDIDEHMERELPPEELVRRISAEKARPVREQAGMDAVVIAADTVVALDGAVLGKPADELEAFKMLYPLRLPPPGLYRPYRPAGGGAAHRQRGDHRRFPGAERGGDLLLHPDRRAHGQGGGLRYPGPGRAAH